MEKEQCKKYLCMLGSELQRLQVTGEILIFADIILYLDCKKPKLRGDINAYVQGDETALEVPKDIASYFDGEGIALHNAATAIAVREDLPDNWLEAALQELFYEESKIDEKWLEYPSLRVYLAAPAYMLSLQIATANPSQNIEKCKYLLENLCITTDAALLALLIKYIPQELMTANIYSTIKKLFAKEHNLFYTDLENKLVQ